MNILHGQPSIQVMVPVVREHLQEMQGFTEKFTG